MGLSMQVLGAGSPEANPGPLLTSPEKVLQLSMFQDSCAGTGPLDGFSGTHAMMEVVPAHHTWREAMWVLCGDHTPSSPTWCVTGRGT